MSMRKLLAMSTPPSFDADADADDDVATSQSASDN